MASENTKTRVEQALARLGVGFGWQDEDLYLFDTGRLAEGEEMAVRMTVRDSCLQLTTPVYDDLSPEQVSVVVWQEWQRRGEPTFLLLPEQEGHPLLVASRIPRLPAKHERPGQLAGMIGAALKALARSRHRVSELLDDVLEYEKGTSDDAAF